MKLIQIHENKWRNAVSVPTQKIIKNSLANHSSFISKIKHALLTFLNINFTKAYIKVKLS